MALTKDQKKDIVAEVNELLKESKMTVVANYQGTGVKDLQDLRRLARENNTKVKVIKNRLFKQALSSNNKYKDADDSEIKSQLLYAFNSEDEVAPAQSLAKFAKSVPSLKFVGAFTDEGKFISADEVKELSDLPSKPELIGSLINTLNSPLNDLTSGLSGDLHGLLEGIEAKAAA